MSDAGRRAAIACILWVSLLACIAVELALGPNWWHWTTKHDAPLLAGYYGLIGALIGEAAFVRASLLKPGHLWPWEARTGTKPLGVGKYLVVAATDQLFGFLAGVVVYGEHVGLNVTAWKAGLTLFFAGMSGPEILHRLGGTIRK